ncbi:MAG: hypothetical protein KAV87_43040, partial [Desulfobacteraceae bacterium]|nr:hypothetical protein [Desulfobacteraceae bacterium]
GYSWRIKPSVNRIFSSVINHDKRFNTFKGILYSKIYSLKSRSHFNSTYFYSSLAVYPFRINQPDMWSSWFRPLSIALIASRYPESFDEECKWRMPWWPGLGCDPFMREPLSID